MTTRNEEISDAITAAINDTAPETAEATVIGFCLDDHRNVHDVAATARWCSRLKALEGRTIRSVTWEQGDKPYFRNLVIHTESGDTALLNWLDTREGVIDAQGFGEYRYYFGGNWKPARDVIRGAMDGKENIDI